MLYDATRLDLSVAVIGDHGSGKSTLIGHLRHQCKCVSDHELVRVIQAATAAKTPSLAYAWLSDKRRSDRERRMTTSSRDALLVTTKYNIDLVDTPGHHSYRKHAISALATTDHAMLVVDASDGVFEEGMKEENGALRELLLVAFTVGTKQLIVAVTKMDKVSFVYDRFDAIRRVIGAYALQLGFQSSAIQFVPVVGLQGENLTNQAKPTIPWYAGPSLREALDRLPVPDRSIDKPLRLPVQDIYDAPDGGVIVTGRIQTGSVRCGMHVALAPGGADATIQSIEAHDCCLKSAYAGTAVGVKLMGISRSDVYRGDILSSVLCDQALGTSKFTAHVVFLDHPKKKKARPGFAPTLHCHALQTQVEISEIVALLDRRTGQRVERGTCEETATTVEKGDACEIVCMPWEGTAAVEAFLQYPSLGRIVLRDHGRTIAVGTIKSVEKIAP